MNGNMKKYTIFILKFKLVNNLIGGCLFLDVWLIKKNV